MRFLQSVFRFRVGVTQKDEEVIRSFQQGAFRHFLAAMATAAAMVLAAGCANRESPTGPTVVVTPAPPAADISGTWKGTYSPADIVDCDSGPAQASFQQEDSIVTGTLSAASDCGFNQGSFHGTLQGTVLSGGLVTDNSRFYGGRATGSLSGNALDITLVTLTGRYSGGQMNLHR